MHKKRKKKNNAKPRIPKHNPQNKMCERVNWVCEDCNNNFNCIEKD